MTLSLRAMRYLQAALQYGTITAAAEAMHVAPSAIASALNQAEDAFGMALVTRARAKGVFPTSAGRDVQRRMTICSSGMTLCSLTYPICNLVSRGRCR